jgi:hypothetical protein
MSRHERRKAKKRKYGVGDVWESAFGLLDRGDPNYGLPVWCSACGASHKARGICRITKPDQSFEYCAVCDTCLPADDTAAVAVANPIMRKYLGTPDYTFIDGDRATTEQVEAISERLRGATEH